MLHLLTINSERLHSTEKELFSRGRTQRTHRKRDLSIILGNSRFLSWPPFQIEVHRAMLHKAAPPHDETHMKLRSNALSLLLAGVAFTLRCTQAATGDSPPTLEPGF